MSVETTAGATNRLIHETSPYLLQHANNPVDWYPWGAEALERAKTEHKPILLSIGYAACHWCHVMERESFEDPRIAALMNQHFVCIKVDREERPDLDDIYMAATVAMSGSGGWPMTVFLTPEQQPFFAGTYFPPVDKYGRPGFPSLLKRVAQAWAEDHDSILAQALELTEHIRAQSAVPSPAPVSLELIPVAVAQLAKSYDPTHGGFGGAPKFPPSATLRLLINYHAQTADARALDMLRGTLDGMKNGGMYDHIGGGFSRYSTDERWLVPHFEKMLYDNAQLSRVYVEAFQLTQEPEYARVARETFDYVLREMQAPAGGYYSATDADSEGEEGKFFVWTPEEVAAALESASLPNGASDWLCRYYDIYPHGNWEGKSIPNTKQPLEQVAKSLGLGVGQFRDVVNRARFALYSARERRVHPLLDDKLLVSWNGMMLGSLAEGYRVLGDERYLESAARAAQFLLTALRRPDGGLFRTANIRDGVTHAHLDAYLEDYAWLVDGLIDVVEAGGPQNLLHEALALAERMLADFGDAGGALFNTARGHEQLLVRTREGHDGAIPAANAIAARGLARLGRHYARADLSRRAEEAIAAYAKLVDRQPRGFATTLHVAQFLAAQPVELCFSGPAVATAALRAASARVYLPARVIAHARPQAAEPLPPLCEGKDVSQPALYVCRDFSCQAPIHDPALVEAALAEAVKTAASVLPSRVGGGSLPGHATQAATAEYAARFEGNLGGSGTLPGYSVLSTTHGALSISRLGFGGYRTDDHDPQHRAALKHALCSGINLLDTSTNYTGGGSERLIGEVLCELTQAGQLKREAVVVVSKVGYVQGSNLELAQTQVAQGKPVPEMVEYTEDCWHCIHPTWIADQLSRSLERLGLESLDVYLLHNPEYFFSAARLERPNEATRSEFYRRVEAAFVQLEREIAAGRLGAYGVSSNTLVKPASDPEATDLAQFLAAAERAAMQLGLAEHHFRVVQLPFNLLEAGALLEPNHQESNQRPESVLEFAARQRFADEQRLCVLINRPLNAITNQGLVRLADPPGVAEAPPVSQANGRVAALELEYRRSFAPELRAPKGSPKSPASFFDWASRLEQLHPGGKSPLTSLEQWQDIEHRLVARETARYLGAVDGAFQGAIQDAWRDWRGRYVRALDEYLSALREFGASASRAKLEPLRRALAEGTQREVLSLSQLALATLLSAAGVTSVLVGMRQEVYVDDALSALGQAPVDARSVLLRTQGVR